ncbi:MULTISPECIES: hypothetical protein [Pedobacter]|uniref:hypothetical protein n=1 Tax=Pedobacter TaxID=84567 RepID=UPI00210F0571|nr:MULTISPECIES: hypothetical protein [unclassified Pedobacter]
MLIFIHTPPDGGAAYAETNMARLFPEPLNALTSCFFLAIAIYWTIKLRGEYRKHRFLSIALALLYIGGVGGTIYHGLRQWGFFIMMDWLPILLLCLSAGVYFLAKIVKWSRALWLIVLYGALQLVLRGLMAQNPHLFININYALMAMFVLLPVTAYLKHTGWVHGKWVGIALLSFILALTFRIADNWLLLESGTHFLWHTFGALASFSMFNYIYLLNAEKSEQYR